MDKVQKENEILDAIRPCEGNVNTIVSALTNYLPFEWSWVADGPNGTIRITSEVVNIEIRGKNAQFEWKV